MARDNDAPNPHVPLRAIRNATLVTAKRIHADHGFVNCTAMIDGKQVVGHTIYNFNQPEVAGIGCAAQQRLDEIAAKRARQCAAAITDELKLVNKF